MMRRVIPDIDLGRRDRAPEERRAKAEIVISAAGMVGIPHSRLAISESIHAIDISAAGTEPQVRRAHTQSGLNVAPAHTARVKIAPHRHCRKNGNRTIAELLLLCFADGSFNLRLRIA